MRTSSRSTAVVLFDEFELLDIAGPLQVLTMAGRTWNFRPFKVYGVAARPGLISTRNQIRVEATHTFGDCPKPEIVFVPGGYGARRALADDEFLQWLRVASGSATHLVGIGNGALPLGKVGALDGADVSVPADMLELLSELAPSSRADVHARFRESGKVLTAATPAGAVEVALYLVEKYVGKKQALSVAASLGVSWTSASNATVTIVE